MCNVKVMTRKGLVLLFFSAWRIMLMVAQLRVRLSLVAISVQEHPTQPTVIKMCFGLLGIPRKFCLLGSKFWML